MKKIVPTGNRTQNSGFKDLCDKPFHYKNYFSVWGLNPRPSAHKTDALPTELTES